MGARSRRSCHQSVAGDVCQSEYAALPRTRTAVRCRDETDESPAQEASIRWEQLHSGLSYKRLERGTFHLSTQPAPGCRHVELDAGDLALMLEGVDLRGARRHERWRRLPHEAALAEPTAAAP